MGTLDICDPVAGEQVVVTPVTSDFGSWDGFVTNHSDGSPFHLTAWQNTIQKTFGHEPMHIVARASEGGPIIGLLPLFLVRSRIFGHMLVSTPQAAYGGILANSETATQALYQRAKTIAKDLN